MVTIELQDVADTIVRRAERHGFVVPRDIRAEVLQAGLPASLWKDVLDLARPSLNYRHGRYYHLHTISERAAQEEDSRKVVSSSVRQLVHEYRESVNRLDRREADRIDFVHPVQVQIEQRTYHVLTRDISPTGVRLLGTRSFLGQKINVLVPAIGNAGPWRFVVQVLWTCSVGDELFENGGVFVESLCV